MLDFLKIQGELHMRKFNKGSPFHGSEKIKGGKLTGSTDTDYFYFFCPQCGDTHILQILDYTIVSEGPVEYAKEDRSKTNRDFSIAFELFCPKCKIHDFVKISNTGWQGGKLADTILFRK